MRLIVPNLTFEDDLAGRRGKVSVHAQRALRELAPLIGLMAEDSDIVVVPEVPRPEDIPDCLQHARFCRRSELTNHHVADMTSLLPWGWTEPLRTMAADFGYDLANVPSSTAVYEVNSRRFNAGCDLLSPAAAANFSFAAGAFGLLCDSMQAWTDAVRQLHAIGYDRWVTKTQISHAGRNRLLGSGVELNDQQRGWLTKQLTLNGGVYLEPRVQVIEECGLQFEIAQLPVELNEPRESDGSSELNIKFSGIAQLINDDVGRYRGSLIAADRRLETSWQAAIEHGFAVCRAARVAGYWGPLGIDAFRFALPTGTIATRLSNDINGRFTMGRVALHLGKWLQSDEYGLWTHHLMPTNPMEFAAYSETFRKLEANGVRTIATSPLQIGGESVRQGTSLLIGQSLEQLLQVAQTIQFR